MVRSTSSDLCDRVSPWKRDHLPLRTSVYSDQSTTGEDEEGIVCLSTRHLCDGWWSDYQVVLVTRRTTPPTTLTLRLVRPPRPLSSTSRKRTWRSSLVPMMWLCPPNSCHVSPLKIVTWFTTSLEPDSTFGWWRLLKNYQGDRVSPWHEKKNGDVIWEDGTELEFKIAWYLYDKFIVIKRKESRIESNPDPDLKPQHKYGEVVEGKPGTGSLMQPDPYIEFLENWIPIGECTELWSTPWTLQTRVQCQWGGETIGFPVGSSPR